MNNLCTYLPLFLPFVYTLFCIVICTFCQEFNNGKPHGFECICIFWWRSSERKGGLPSFVFGYVTFPERHVKTFSCEVWSPTKKHTENYLKLPLGEICSSGFFFAFFFLNGDLHGQLLVWTCDMSYLQQSWTWRMTKLKAFFSGTHFHYYWMVSQYIMFHFYGFLKGEWMVEDCFMLAWDAGRMWSFSR